MARRQGGWFCNMMIFILFVIFIFVSFLDFPLLTPLFFSTEALSAISDSPPPPFFSPSDRTLDVETMNIRDFKTKVHPSPSVSTRIQ